MYKMVLKLDVGDRAAPLAINGKEYDIGARRDVNTLLVFLPWPDKRSADVMDELKENHGNMADTEVIVLIDGRADIEAPFRISVDPGLKSAKVYDAYDNIDKRAYPAAFIVDGEGVIQYVYRGYGPENPPPISYIADKLRRMKEGKP